MSAVELAGSALLSHGPRSSDSALPYLLAGRSAEGRPIWFESVAPLDRPVRVLLVAGQHGDEPEATDALRGLVARRRSWLDSLGIGIGVVANANPDGRVARTRWTRESVDLNRDHMALRSVEAATLHRVLRSRRWDVVIDLHTYPSRRRAALRRGWVLDDDVLLSTATTPAALRGPSGVTERVLVRDLAPGLDSEGITVGEYRLFQPSGRIRRGTMTPVDLRNVAALRYGSLSILVEGRSPRPDDPDRERSRLVLAQAVLLGHLLEWISRHPTQFPGDRPLPRPGDRVAVGGRWKASGQPGRARIRDAITGERRIVELAPFLDTVEETRSISLPVSYRVAREERELLGMLLRQGFRPEAQGEGRWLAFSVRQSGGVGLAVWLEREMMGELGRRGGIHRLEAAPIDLAADRGPVSDLSAGPAAPEV